MAHSIADLPSSGDCMQSSSTKASRHLGDRIVMVLDGAGWHQSESLVLASNLRLLKLPPYSPESEPGGASMDELREKSFHTSLDSLDALENHLEIALHDMELDRERAILSSHPYGATWSDTNARRGSDKGVSLLAIYDDMQDGILDPVFFDPVFAASPCELNYFCPRVRDHAVCIRQCCALRRRDFVHEAGPSPKARKPGDESLGRPCLVWRSGRRCEA